MMDDYIPANEAADLLHVSRATGWRRKSQRPRRPGISRWAKPQIRGG